MIKNQKNKNKIETNTTPLMPLLKLTTLCTESRSKIILTSILGEKHKLKKLFERSYLFLFEWLGYKWLLKTGGGQYKEAVGTL